MGTVVVTGGRFETSGVFVIHRGSCVSGAISSVRELLLLPRVVFVFIRGGFVTSGGFVGGGRFVIGGGFVPGGGFITAGSLSPEALRHRALLADAQVFCQLHQIFCQLHQTESLAGRRLFQR